MYCIRCIIFFVRLLLGKQRHLWQMHPIGGGIKRTALHYGVFLLVDTQCLINRLVDPLNPDRILNGLARPFIRRFSKYRSFFYSSTKHQYGAPIGKMAVHPIIADVINYIGLVYLVQYFGARASLHDHVAAKFAGDDNQCAVQMSTAIQVFDQLSYGCIDELLHIPHAYMAIFVGIPTHKWFILGSYADKPRTLLDKPPGHQTSQSEFAGVIYLVLFLRFLPQVECLGLGRLK